VSGSFSGSTELSTLRDYSTYSWSDDFAWILGRHTLMMGVDTFHTRQEGYSVSRTHGLYSFTGNYSGLGLSDYFLGRPSTFRQRQSGYRSHPRPSQRRLFPGRLQGQPPPDAEHRLALRDTLAAQVRSGPDVLLSTRPTLTRLSERACGRALSWRQGYQWRN